MQKLKRGLLHYELRSPDGVHPDAEIREVSCRCWTIRIGQVVMTIESETPMRITTSVDASRASAASLVASVRVMHTPSLLKTGGPHPMTWSTTPPRKRKRRKSR
jgi:hypothetical protein